MPELFRAWCVAPYRDVDQLSGLCTALFGTLALQALPAQHSPMSHSCPAIPGEFGVSSRRRRHILNPDPSSRRAQREWCRMFRSIIRARTATALSALAGRSATASRRTEIERGPAAPVRASATLTRRSMSSPNGGAITATATPSVGGKIGSSNPLGSVQMVMRCPRTLAQDSIHGSVNYTANDRFCLNGQRLMVISGTYGANNAEYRAPKSKPSPRSSRTARRARGRPGSRSG